MSHPLHQQSLRKLRCAALAALQAEFEAARGEMSKEAARAAKLEKKVAILTGKG